MTSFDTKSLFSYSDGEQVTTVEVLVLYVEQSCRSARTHYGRKGTVSRLATRKSSYDGDDPLSGMALSQEEDDQVYGEGDPCRYWGEECAFRVMSWVSSIEL